VRRGSLILTGVITAILATVVVVLALPGGGSPERAGSARAASLIDPMAPLARRTRRPQVVEPVAGESAAVAGLPTEQPGADAADGPAPAPPPVPARRRAGGPTADAAISQAEVLSNGIALPPIEAPDEVRRIIEAGNSIARTPYLWGGGHGKWLDRGYDCSGSISFALANAGLLDAPLDSGRLMHWGRPGKGRWVSIYTNPGHVYMVVAGVRFDTSGRRVTGSRWQRTMRRGGSFVVRHPAGL
jgi:hypothetical protein